MKAMTKRFRFVECSCCGIPIDEGEECYVDHMGTGIFCSVGCWAKVYGRADRKILTQDLLERDGSAQFKELQFPVCEHKHVSIIPTPDTSYGLSDRYHLECEDCKGIILEDATREFIKEQIDQNNYEVTSGEKYL